MGGFAILDIHDSDESFDCWWIAGSMATAPIETWDALVAAISAEDAPTFSLPDDWCYQGASPDDLRAYAARELSGVGPKEAATALIRASILIQILGTRKSTDLGEKKAKFKEGVQKAVMANKTSQKEVSGLRGYSLNAVGAAFPELALIFLTSSSGKPTPALQQLALRPSLRDALRSRDQGIIDKNGENMNTEAAKVAQAAQERARLGSEGRPLLAGPELKKRIMTMAGAFEGGKPEISGDSPLAKVFEHIFNNPAEVFKNLSEKPSVWHNFILKARE